MIGPLKLIASCIALVLVYALLITLSTSPVEAGPEGAPDPGDDTMPAPQEWVMVLLLFALVTALHHHRSRHRQQV